MAEWDGFEIRCTLAGTVGSNPTFSAISFLGAERTPKTLKGKDDFGVRYRPFRSHINEPVKVIFSTVRFSSSPSETHSGLDMWPQLREKLASHLTVSTVASCCRVSEGSMLFSQGKQCEHSP